MQKKFHCQNVAKFGPCMGPGFFFFSQFLFCNHTGDLVN